MRYADLVKKERTDMKIRPTKEQYEASQKPGKKVPASAWPLRVAIRELREARALARLRRDPLLAPLPLALRLERLRRARREAAAKAQAEAQRKALLLAARVARGMGLAVRSSKDRAGRVSSYYAVPADGRTIRISDHLIPWTPTRATKAAFTGRGGYSGYPGVEIIIDRPRSKTWIRRALILAINGRWAQ